MHTASFSTRRLTRRKTGIPYLDADNRRADFHALRHIYGSLVSQAGVAPRVAMTLMRHTDIRLTMNVYTDARIFDLAGAVEQLPALPAANSGSNDAAGWSKSGPTRSAGIDISPAVIGRKSASDEPMLTTVNEGVRHHKSPSGVDGLHKRAKGFEPRRGAGPGKTP
jgi:hypothetical protein